MTSRPNRLRPLNGNRPNKKTYMHPSSKMVSVIGQRPSFFWVAIQPFAPCCASFSDSIAFIPLKHSNGATKGMLWAVHGYALSGRRFFMSLARAQRRAQRRKKVQVSGCCLAFNHRCCFSIEKRSSLDGRELHSSLHFMECFIGFETRSKSFVVLSQVPV